MKRTSILAASLMCSVMLSAQTREAAVLFSGGGDGMDESYLLTENVSVVFDEEGNATVFKGETSTGLSSDCMTPLTAEFKDAFKLTANQDPNHKENFYSTFYTGLGAYKVSSEAKAYIGEVSGDVLNLTDVGSIIHENEAVILKATGSSITLMPSCNTGAPSYDNKLTGTENGIASAPANSYALSLGQKGVGFYLWEGKAIGANKAYLTLTASAGAKAFTFQFDDGETTGIQEASPTSSPEGKDLMYNLNGVRVNDNHKGVVIKNGKKILKK